MGRRTGVTLSLAVMTLLTASVSYADAASNDGSGSANKGNSIQYITYVPPFRGAPPGRIGGGTRYPTRINQVETVTLKVLAPDHIGLTTQAGPTLYWFLSGVFPEGLGTRLEFSVIDDLSIDPVVEKVFKSPVSAGVQKISLKELGVELAAGVEYQWFVSLVHSSDQSNLDLLATGRIRRIDAADRDIESPPAGDSVSQAKAYAKAGVWYDALAVLSGRIEEEPKDKLSILLRDQLLEQIGF